MAVQGRLNLATYTFILSGQAYALTNETLKQDAGRAADLLANTVVSLDPVTNKWVPFTDEAAVDGTEKPTGVILDTVAQADIVAGDVTGISVLVGAGCAVDKSMLVIENAKTLLTVIGTLNITVEQCLRWAGIYMEPTIDITSFEN
jgi:hypothetical protein